MWEDFEFDGEKVPNIKLGIHLGQILFGFIVWVLEIVVFRADGAVINGHVGWTFAVCFLSVPAWIYLAMAPRFPRTRHLAEPHVMVTVDAVYTILWLSAFSTQAAYNTANLCGTGCSTSKAIVGMAFFVCLFFGITTFLSIYSLKYYQFNGRLPGYDRIQAKNQNIDPDKAAFSMTPHGHGDDAYAPIHGDNEHDPMDPRDDHGGYSSYGGPSSQHGSTSGYGGGNGGEGRQGSPYGQGRQESPYGGGRQSSPYNDDAYGQQQQQRPQQQQENPFEQGRQDNNPFDDHVGYTPPAGSDISGPNPHRLSTGGAVLSSAGVYVPPTAQDDYDDGRPVQFPAANYDRAR